MVMISSDVAFLASDPLASKDWLLKVRIPTQKVENVGQIFFHPKIRRMFPEILAKNLNAQFLYNGEIEYLNFFHGLFMGPTFLFCF